MSGGGERPDPVFDLSGGALCLDFANTLSGRGTQAEIEELGEYGHLVAWGRQAGVLDPDAVTALAELARNRPRQAEAVRRRAITLREAIFRIFARAASGEAPGEGDLAELNGSLGRALGHLRLSVGPTGAGWGWEDDAPTLDRVLWPVAWSAAEMLTRRERLERVRECASGTCRWLFLDRSRNRSRRWCDMKVCGNRDKARRHYRKTKGRRR
jgi:predicted RNA-binding Zn ribbon-like protein